VGTLFHQAPLLAGPACYGQFSRLGSPKLVAPKPRKEAQPGIEKKNKVPIPQVTFINDLEPPIYIPLSYIYYLKWTLMVQLFEPKNAPKIKKVGTLQTRLGGPKGVLFDGILRDITFGGVCSSW